MKKISILSASLVFIFNLNSANASNLQFKGAFVAEPPPGVSVLAAYMTIENSDSQNRIIKKVTSQDFASIEIHKSLIEDGIAKMRPLESLPIAKNSSVTLAPGGLHLMLHKPSKPLRAGDLVFLDFEEADGTVHNMAVYVRATSDKHNHHQHH